MTPEAYAWFILLVPPGREKAVRMILSGAGFECYVPMRREFRHSNKVTRIQRKKHAVEYPIMPGYLFIGHPRDGQPRWGRVFDFRVVRGVMGHDGAPRPLSASTVASMMDREARHEFDAPSYQRWMETHHEWAVGDMVTDGALRGKVVEIAGSIAKFEAELFGSVRQITAPIKRLRAAE